MEKPEGSVGCCGCFPPQDVVKCTLFVKDLSGFSAVNEVYAGYFTAPFPARSCVEVAALPKGVLVEIEAIAAVNALRWRSFPHRTAAWP